MRDRTRDVLLPKRGKHAKAGSIKDDPRWLDGQSNDVWHCIQHGDPRTTMRNDRARTNLDRHPNYLLAAFMASGT